jgi:hypothetical protein
MGKKWYVDLIKNLKGKDRSEDLGIYGKRLLIWILRKWNVDWIHVA